LEEAEAVCDRVAIVDGGRLLALDSPRHLLDDLGSSVLEVNVAADPRSVVDLLASAPPVRHRPIVRHQQVTAVADGDGAGLAELVGAVQSRAVSVVVRRATLNDVFLQLTAGKRTPVGALS
ncbi:MAG TPA: hypothetical protein VKD67_03105, partial [Acidimicrobiales bacterium]|nr:hypothetical protein [Acidimicrobiales bacterium]